jgi:nitric oxide reductase subunit B
LLLIVGLVLWIVILGRGLWGKLKTESPGNLPSLFFYSALSIPLFYAVGLLCHTKADFAIMDFWRFWVVHLWVEDFLELFTTIMVAYIFVLLGVVSEKTATRVVYFDIILYSFGGVVGTDAPHVFQRQSGDPHGARRVFLSGGDHSPDVPDGGGLDVPAPRRTSAKPERQPIPASLGGHVPCCGRVLEFSRRGCLRLPH